MTTALVPIADGVEEMEAVIIIDILRRAEWKVTVAGLEGDIVTASRGVRLVPDCAWREIDPADLDVLVLPGGAKGADALARDRGVLDAVQSFVRSGKLVGAICAAPLVLQQAGVLEGRRATCHPSLASRFAQARWVDDAVVVDRPIITSQGAGTAFDFVLAIIRAAGDGGNADKIADAIVLGGQRERQERRRSTVRH